MIHAADVREWRNRDVVDAESRRIGVLEAVYVDTTTDEPAMATVRIGLPTRHRLLFVPIENAIVGPDYLRVGYVRTLVKRAPSIGTDDVLLGRAGGSDLQPLRTGLPARCGRRTATGASLTTYGRDTRSVKYGPCAR